MPSDILETPKPDTRLENEDGAPTVESVIKRLQTFVSDSGQLGPSSILLSSITPSLFYDILDNLGGLENLRFDYREHEKVLIFYLPLVGHEIMASLMSAFVEKPDDVIFGGSAMAWLQDGAKCPDFSIFSDQHPDPSQRFRERDGNADIIGCPTVVVEVAYSEKHRDLAVDCGRWIACSLGRVRLAIGIDIDYTFERKKDSDVEERILNSITCSTWVIKGIEQNVTQRDGEEIDVLMRTDNQTGKPATQFSCLSLISPDLCRFHSICRHRYQVYPDDGGVQHEAIKIRRKHVYRSLEPGYNDVVFKITLQQILDAALAHHKLQLLADMTSSNELTIQMIKADIESFQQYDSDDDN